MKKILVLLCIFAVMLFSSCRNAPVNEEPELSVTEEKEIFPVSFSLDNLDIVLNEIVETKNIEFDDNGTKIKLNNEDGKYIVLNYSLKNNETFDIDIDHSLDVSVICDDGNIYYGEYYENKTGKENINLKSGETKDVLFVCDLGSSKKFVEAVFKYNEKIYEYKK